MRRHVGKLQLLDDRVALVHGEEVVAGLETPCGRARRGRRASARGRPCAKFEQEDRVAARDRLLRAFECLEFHALHVKLDEVDA